MKNITQTFVTYHGCGNCYIDGTKKIVPKGRHCINPTLDPFWKNLVDVRNKVQTRAQIKSKVKADRNFVRRYQKYLRVFSKSKDYFSSDDFSSNYSSTSENKSDNESTTCNASVTEHDVSDTELNTGENLIIDKNIKNEHEHEHPLSCSCTKTQTLNNTQNPDNKNEKLQQEAETNNKILPFNI